MKKYRLGDIAKVYNGSTPSSSHPEYYGGDIIWLTPKDLSNQNTKYIERGERTITKAGYDSCSTTIIPAGNILMSSRAPIGLLAINKFDCCTNQGFKNLIVNKDLANPEYLYYFLLNNIESIKKLGTGTTFQEVSKTTLENFELLLPTLPEQERIAKVLSDIDSKIALNKKINRELETMAKEIYDYWFVQFDFPNEEGKTYKSSGGKMQWNDVLKREIPTGWEVRKLGDLLVKIDSGKRPKGGIDKSLKTGIPSLGAECIDDLGVFDFSSTPFLPESFKDKLTTGIIENNDILVYKDGAYVGKCTLFRDEFPFKFAAVNEHVFLLKAKDLIFQEYLLFTLKQETYFNIMQTLGKAKAAQPGLNQDDLKSIPIIVPEKNILKQFHKIMNKNLEELFCNAKVNKELTQLRDELLPLLMNGQVVIKK